MKPKQKFIVTIEVAQNCSDDMTELEFEKWIKEQFYGCDYGDVKITNCKLELEPQ